MSEFGKEIVRVENIYKSFPGVKALKGVSFSVHQGEVHALVGENGAGKSTLIKILMGVYNKDSGEIYIDGQKVEIKNTIQAKGLGLGAVYQDITLAPHLSVAENFFLGKPPMTSYSTIDWQKMNNDTSNILKNLDIHINPRTRVNKLTVAQQEMVTIAKTVYEKAKIIIFDEPTALLANEEVMELFGLIDRLKKEQVAIIYISHRMEEIFKICDTVTVLKDGQLIKTINVPETDQDHLISLMVGRNIEDMFSIEHLDPGKEVLKVKNLKKKNRFDNINFELHKSEILGLFGLVGAGRTDIVRCIFGAEQYDSGEIFINDKKAIIKSPEDGINNGIGFLPEDRKMQGLALALSVGINTNLATYDKISKFNIIDLKKESDLAKMYVKELGIKTPSIGQKVRNLSGGNQQKVVISKWLERDSNIFIFDEPTVGVDVGAKVEIYKLFEKILRKGNSIILISSYLPEIMGLADRIIVISEGKQMKILKREEFNDEKILRLASGIKN